MLKEVRAAGFSKDSVSELFNLLERTVEHKDYGIIIYVCNVDESALTTFQEKHRKCVIEKCNIAYLVSLKCEESNHYNSYCLLCHAAGCCASPMVNTKRQEDVKT